MNESESFRDNQTAPFLRAKRFASELSKLEDMAILPQYFTLLNPKPDTNELILDLDRTKRKVDPEDVQHALNMIQQVLNVAPITEVFKSHIMKQTNDSVAKGIFAAIGYSFLLNECGVDFLKEKYGIFDSKDAKVIEREAIRANYPNPYIIPELAREHEQLMKRWVKAYEETYNERFEFSTNK